MRSLQEIRESVTSLSGTHNRIIGEILLAILEEIQGLRRDVKNAKKSSGNS